MPLPFGTPIPIPNGHYQLIRLNDTTAVIANYTNEWAQAILPADQQDLPEQGEISTLPSDLDVTRWTANPSDSEIRILPAFPDLSLIARTRGVITLPPGGEAQFFLGIPATREVLAESAGFPISLVTLPAKVLTKTWHGNQHVGTACYSLDTRARREISNLELFHDSIICPLTVRNQSPESLSFEHLFIDPQHFAIYSTSDQLWSSAATLTVRDPGETFTRLKISHKAPASQPNATELVGPATVDTGKAQVHKAFSSYYDVLS